MEKILESKFSIIERQMELKLEEIREDFKHSGNKGTNIEEIIREFLSSYLPPFNRVGHGEVIDTFGGNSKQIDVVITNNYHPYINELKLPSLFLLEGVSCVGEIKTVLTSQELEKVYSNVASFKSLQMNLPPETTVTGPPSDVKRFTPSRAYFLFAFESQLSFEDVFQKLNAKYKDEEFPIRQQIDCVVILNRGVIINTGDGMGAIKVLNNQDQRIGGFAPFTKTNNGGCLLQFFFWLSTVMLHMEYKAPIIIPYLVEKLE